MLSKSIVIHDQCDSFSFCPRVCRAIVRIMSTVSSCSAETSLLPLGVSSYRHTFASNCRIKAWCKIASVIMTKSKCGERTAHVSWWGCPFRARPNKSTGNKRYQTTFHPICVVIIKVMYFTAFSPATHLQAITPTEKRPYFHKMCTQSLHDAWLRAKII